MCQKPFQNCSVLFGNTFRSFAVFGHAGVDGHCQTEWNEPKRNRHQFLTLWLFALCLQLGWCAPSILENILPYYRDRNSPVYLLMTGWVFFAVALRLSVRWAIAMLFLCSTKVLHASSYVLWVAQSVVEVFRCQITGPPRLFTFHPELGWKLRETVISFRWEGRTLPLDTVCQLSTTQEQDTCVHLHMRSTNSQLRTLTYLHVSMELTPPSGVFAMSEFNPTNLPAEVPHVC